MRFYPDDPTAVGMGAHPDRIPSEVSETRRPVIRQSPQLMTVRELTAPNRFDYRLRRGFKLLEGETND